MRITCEACGKVHVADDRLAGRSFRMQCKRCGSVITVGSAAAVPLPAPAPSPRPAAAEAGGAGEAPVFTFGDEEPARPAGGAGPEAPAARTPAAASAGDDAFADFSRELQEFCEDLEREGPAASPADRPAPAIDGAGWGRTAAAAVPTVADATAPVVDATPAEAATPPADAASSAARTAPHAAAAPEPRRRRNLVPVVALVAIAAGVAAWLVARQPGATPAPSPPVAGGAPAATERPPPVDGPAASSPAPPPPASPAPAAVPAPGAVPGAAAPAVAAAPPAVGQEAVPQAAPPARLQAPPASRGARTERAPAPKVASAAPATSPAAAVPSVPADPPAGPAREPGSPPRSDLPPRDPRAAQAELARLSSAFDDCVADARRSDPELLRGPRSVILTLTVRPSGRTAYPTLDDAQLSGTALGACIKGRAAALVFPEAGGEPVRVRLQLELGQ
ncbi:MAG TPA: hypothetical protein VFM53_14180 [Anaeromyxobacteraceae bacterium]|nr:hypothetical protein [Anaeromyxobacteraceae bacterium]